LFGVLWLVFQSAPFIWDYKGDPKKKFKRFSGRLQAIPGSNTGPLATAGSR
jgi:hypothetical protein